MKAKILKVGMVDERGYIMGWKFDGRGKAFAIEVKDDGEILYGGYTLKELKKISDKHIEELLG